MGATEILISDLVQDRLDVAKKLGATYTMLLNRDDPAEKVQQRIHDIMSEAPDASIDCCGAESSTRVAIFVRTLMYHKISIVLIYLHVAAVNTIRWSRCRRRYGPGKYKASFIQRAITRGRHSWSFPLL